MAAGFMASDIAVLGELAPGTAYVESIEVLADETIVKLRYAWGTDATVSVRAVPRADDYVPPAKLGRLLAVRVRNLAATAECSVLGTSRGGPKRVPITLAQALALADTGVHTVLLND